MRIDPLLDDDIELLARERARALAFIDRVREAAFAVLPLRSDSVVSSQHERHEIIEAIASLYAKRRARALRASATPPPRRVRH
jgi:hypothetical protein